MSRRKLGKIAREVAQKDQPLWLLALGYQKKDRSLERYSSKIQEEGEVKDNHKITEL